MQCISRIRVRHPEGHFHDVPCGKCNFCLQNRRAEWSFRLQCQLKVSQSAHFLTLTYEDDQVPYWFDVETGECWPVVRKDHLQKFIKRLRKLSCDKLKYYAVGEYGDKFGRPHYHVILFGLDPAKADQVEKAWNSGRDVKEQRGFVKIGTVTNNSIDYTLRYVVNRHDFDHLPAKPFSLISKGLGLVHYEENSELYEKRDFVVGGRGYKQSLPRYYRDRRRDVDRVSRDIKAEKLKENAYAARAAEVERLKKFHSDPDAHFEERLRAAHDRIRSRKRSKGNDSM